jgi:hypothetical protein
MPEKAPPTIAMNHTITAICDEKREQVSCGSSRWCVAIINGGRWYTLTEKTVSVK